MCNVAQRDSALVDEVRLSIQGGEAGPLGQWSSCGFLRPVLSPARCLEGSCIPSPAGTLPSFSVARDLGWADVWEGPESPNASIRGFLVVLDFTMSGVHSLDYINLGEPVGTRLRLASHTVIFKKC